MKVLDSIANNSKNIISISIFLMAVMSVLSTNFSKPLFGDEFYYLLKAFEMKYGNWEVFLREPEKAIVRVHPRTGEPRATGVHCLSADQRIGKTRSKKP